MKVNLNIKKNLQIPAFYLFFIICNIQIGVGILGVPKYIFMESKQDAWISVLIAIAFMLLVLYVIFLILNQYKNADLFGIQVDIFGRWIGKILGTLFIVYFLNVAMSVLLTYVHVIQLFIYPTMSSFLMGLLLLSLVVYGILGGIRVIVGITFIFFILTPWILIFLYDPISRMEMTHFQPMFQTSIKNLLKGARKTTYTFLGFEILFIIYPFIQNKSKAKLSTFFGVIFTGLVVFATTVISIGYYSPQDFSKIDWPVLQLFKSISYPLLERFDYIVVVEWMLLTIPTIMLSMWVVTYGTKRLFKVKQKTMLYIISIILLTICSMTKNHYATLWITDLIAQIGFWIAFIYPFILLVLVLIKKKLLNIRGVTNNDS